MTIIQIHQESYIMYFSHRNSFPTYFRMKFELQIWNVPAFNANEWSVEKCFATLTRWRCIFHTFPNILFWHKFYIKLAKHVNRKNSRECYINLTINGDLRRTNENLWKCIVQQNFQSVFRMYLKLPTKFSQVFARKCSSWALVESFLCKVARRVSK